jgi:hypothetical protein
VLFIATARAPFAACIHHACRSIGTRFRAQKPSVIDAMTHSAITATNLFAMTPDVAWLHKLQSCFSTAHIL